jgi:methylmalonyl-CoA mutase, C-terminal domain
MKFLREGLSSEVQLSAAELSVRSSAETLPGFDARPAYYKELASTELSSARSKELTMAPDRKIRVLVAKPGLDGHDRGAKVIARALRDAGMEVIYTGLRQTPEMVVSASLQEDVDVIGLSILSGAHNAIVPRVMDLLKQNQMDDVLVLVGGIIPDQDVAALKKGGVAAVFQPGTPMDSIIEFIKTNVKPRSVTA